MVSRSLILTGQEKNGHTYFPVKFTFNFPKYKLLVVCYVVELEEHYAQISTDPEAIKSRRLVTHGGDVLLGVVTIPLIGLLTRRTGALHTILYGPSLPACDF